jgi:hypothetical protein
MKQWPFGPGIASESGCLWKVTAVCRFPMFGFIPHLRNRKKDDYFVWKPACKVLKHLIIDE